MPFASFLCAISRARRQHLHLSAFYIPRLYILSLNQRAHAAWRSSAATKHQARSAGMVWAGDGLAALKQQGVKTGEGVERYGGGVTWQ